MSEPRIHVGPEPDADALAAVRRGGGRPVDAADAEAIVWLGHDPGALAAVLHDGVRWVQLPSAGVERWFAAAAIDDRRLWTSASEAYGAAVAEHALALMLAGRRQLQRCARETTWRRDLGGEPLFGATVVVIGTGSIGRALIELLGPWRARIVGVNRRGRSVDGAQRVVTADRLPDVLPEADAVVVAAPATPATARLIGVDELAAMAPHAWLVNVARGSLVDTDALVAALARGSIGGAALDVTDPEPLPDGHPLWREPRALITPHAANVGAAAAPALNALVERQVARWAAGEEPTGRIDPAGGY